MKPTKTELKQNIKYALIREHGLGLIKFFGLDPNLVSPVELCKKLRKLETRAHKITTQLCNGFPDLDHDLQEDYTKHLESELEKIEEKARDLLDSPQLKKSAPTKWARKLNDIFINGDPRGYALKVTTECVKHYENLKQNPEEFPHKDWGGFGILAPDLTSEIEDKVNWISSNWDELNTGTLTDVKADLMERGYFVC